MSENDESIEQTVVQDEAERLRSKDRSSLLSRPDVPGYEVETLLGAGSYGEVWLALQKNTGRKVAIKFFSRFKGLDWPLLQREVGKLVEVLSERRVVHLLQVGWDADPPYYVMEYLSGGSLAEKIAGRTLPAKDAVTVFRDVAEALVYLHGKAILHCDLKPANVLLDDRNQIRLADFGQARLSSEEGPAVGTLFYMAPEQTESGARPDVRSDIYSLGALVHTMLTGKPPYATVEASDELASSRSTKERIARYRQLIETSPVPTAHHGYEDVDRSLAEIVDRCLKKDPGERFPNVPGVIEALDLRERRRTRRPLVVFGLFGPLALVLAMAGVGLWARSEAESRATAALTQQTLESATENAQLIATVVDRNLSAVQRRLEREAEQGALEVMVAGGGGRVLQSHLEDLHEAYRDRYFHSWVVTDNNAVALARAPFDDRVVGARYAYREWFTGEEDIPRDRAPAVAKPREGTGVTLAFESTAEGNPILISVASPIRNGEETIGVLAATIHLETFNEWLAEAEGPSADSGCPNRFAVLLNRGQLVRHPCPVSETARLPVARFDYAERPEVQALVESESGQAPEYRDPLREDRVFLAAFRSFRENEDWSAIVQHDRTQAMSPVTSLVRQFGNLGWIAAGVGVLLVMALWAMLYRVTRDESLLPTRERLIGLDL